jgi:multicomponent K+:H+ antiporter subunit F
MTATVIPFVIGALALAMALALARLLRGPETVDRVLALDTLHVCTVALLVVLGIRWNDGVWFEAALLIGLLGFLGTVALARYLERGKVIG